MQDFGENTDRDVKHALHDLASKGMRRLLFDIRGNPGGPLDQAIKVANEFLPRGKMIVYARARRQFRSGLSRDRRQRVHRHPDRRPHE
jgi:carboxyl-terminal processing protease